MDEMTPWIGFDLDGTLAIYSGWQGIQHIGDPVPAMLEKVKDFLAKGTRIKILTARAQEGPEAVKRVKQWCKEHIGQELEVTSEKDYQMITLYDDRCVQVEPNTGRILGRE